MTQKRYQAVSETQRDYSTGARRRPTVGCGDENTQHPLHLANSMGSQIRARKTHRSAQCEKMPGINIAARPPEPEESGSLQRDGA
jgi:hypothetical protein